MNRVKKQKNSSLRQESCNYLTWICSVQYLRIKSLGLTSITLVDNEYLYDTRSFFSPDGLEKYMTIAKGEEWKGGDVIDDFC